MQSDDVGVLMELSTGCFFFSSRRRHTRSKRDWSSDVCSSDLRRKRQQLRLWLRPQFVGQLVSDPHFPLLQSCLRQFGRKLIRLEIGRGRVGKECRSRWSARREKKKARE